LVGCWGSAEHSTIRQRWTIAWGVERARIRALSVSRCSGESTTRVAKGRGIGSIHAATGLGEDAVYPNAQANIQLTGGELKKWSSSKEHRDFSPA